eukprot:jgi/Chrpa1/4918/Chrysochromulina_OHIO_Genome00016604-RA
MPNAEYVGPIGVFAHDFKNAEKLQAAARGYQGRCEVKRMHKSCLVIIAALRGKRARRAYRKKVRAAEIIQKSVRRKQAALEESRSRVKELFRVEAARTIKRFIDAVDDEDLEALGKVVTTTSTLIVELQGAGVTVSNTYKGVRSFISKKQEASKKGLRHVSLDVMPLRLVAESFTFPRSGTKPALVAEATYVRDVQGGRLQARLEYVVRTANTEDREKGRKAWVLLSMGIPPQCYPPESRAIARDRRALSRHLSRQSVGRSGISWSHHSAVFRLKYNGNLRTGTGIRLAPTVKLKVPLCGHPGQATASTLPLMSTLPSKFEAEPGPGEEAALLTNLSPLSNTIL